MKLNTKAFGLTCGLIWGFGIFFATWWILLWERGTVVSPGIIGMVYRGYTISPLGSLVGLVWATADGWIGGLIFAWLYNGLQDAFTKRAAARQSTSS